MKRAMWFAGPVVLLFGIAVWAVPAVAGGNLPLPPGDARTPETRTRTAEEAARVLGRDWLFQAMGEPLLDRAVKEITWARELAGRLPEAYEPLLLDVMEGDASLFARADEVEKSWEIIDPFIRAWSSVDMPPIDPYIAGEWGPMASVEWMAAQGRTWFDTCPVLS